MGAKAARGILSALFVALLFTVVSCGDDTQDSPAAPPVITGVGTGTGTGSGTGVGTGGSCQGANYAAGTEVLRNGGDTVNSIGSILSVFPYNNVYYATVSFPTAGSTTLPVTDLSTIATCTPTLMNRTVRYTGSASTNFPTPLVNGAPQYQGIAKRAYAGYSSGYLEVDWDHLTPNVIVPFSSIVFTN